MAALWSAALANLGQLFPYGNAPAPAAAPSDNGRKSKHPKSYKPAPLVTPFQKYKKQERASWTSDTVSQYSESLASGSSGDSSSSLTPPDHADSIAPAHAHPTPPGSFESLHAVRVSEDVRLRMEFAKMRVRVHWHERPGRRAHQTQRVQTPAPATASAAPVAPAPPPPPHPGLIVRRWNGRNQASNARREDREILARIRSSGAAPSAAMRWARYERDWAVALDAEDSPMLRFRDVPWPVALAPFDGSHIHAVDVYQFVLCTSDLENVPADAVPRLTDEIERWQMDRFAAQVLPRVFPAQREDVAAAAGAVLDILLKARRDVMSLQTGFVPQ
ncbi:hypothetical protein B0H14DRAFT_3448007 [Mycena olivaceomarginata]|nr:hypothetical protein B0H14DRAFT_3448007 [Mycena olivaceomarginata]